MLISDFKHLKHYSFKNRKLFSTYKNLLISFPTFALMPRKFSFSKEERLKSRKAIAGLFSKGQSYGAYPIRVVWREVELQEGEEVKFRAKTAFTVPKKRFKTAVARNLLKRRMRETYRLNKPRLYRKLEKNDVVLEVMLIFTGKEEADYKTIDKAMGKVLWRLGKVVPRSSTAKSPEEKKNPTQ